MSVLFFPFYLPSDCQEGVSWLQQLLYVPTAIFLWNQANNTARPLSKPPTQSLLLVPCPTWLLVPGEPEWLFENETLPKANGVGFLASFPQLGNTSRHKHGDFVGMSLYEHHMENTLGAHMQKV